jgi:hypothetical protein
MEGDKKGKGVAVVDKGKGAEVVTIDIDDDDAAVPSAGGGGGSGGGGGNNWMADLAREREARIKARGGAAPTSAYAATLRSTAKDRNGGGGGSGGGGSGGVGGNLTGAAARAANLASTPAAADTVGSLGGAVHVESSWTHSSKAPGFNPWNL